MNIYYIYFYLRADFTPYYVGKGKNNRAYSKQHNIKPPNDKSHIILVHEHLSEICAFILERYYIRWFGRKNNGTGILRNCTDGGEGTSGYKYTESQRKHLSYILKGKARKPKTLEHRKKLSISNTISSSKIYKIIEPNGNYYNISNLKKYCYENNLHYNSMCRVANGIRKQYCGYKVIKV